MAAGRVHRLLGVDVDDPPAPWDEHHRTARTADGIDLDIDSSTFAQVSASRAPSTRPVGPGRRIRPSPRPEVAGVPPVRGRACERASSAGVTVDRALSQQGELGPPAWTRTPRRRASG
jgi:hypothetical protein